MWNCNADADGVTLRKLAETSNPVFVDGDVAAEATLASGDAFVIGSTRFEVQQVTQSDSPGQPTDSASLQSIVSNCSEFATTMPPNGLKYSRVCRR